MSALDSIVRAVIAGLSLECILLDETAFDEELRGEAIPGPHEACEEKERAIALLDVLDEIAVFPRCVLARLYGLDGSEPLNHAEVGRIYGYSADHIRNVEARALAQLRPLLSEVA